MTRVNIRMTIKEKIKNKINQTPLNVHMDMFIACGINAHLLVVEIKPVFVRNSTVNVNIKVWIMFCACTILKL